jgi:3-isopropylmalate dehydrogenase
VERCLRFALELAQGRPRRQLTLVHKANVLTYAGDLWQRTLAELKAGYPEVTTNYHHADAACIHLVESPSRYDVIVTDNLFGDLLTDLAGALSGGIGLAASANLNPARTGPSLFEPVHGAAHDIAGTGRANPMAAIKSAVLMLDHLGEEDASGRITKAISSYEEAAAKRSGPGVGPGPTTAEIGDAIAERL